MKKRTRTLTISLRRAIVDRIMADVPRVNYQEQAQKLAYATPLLPEAPPVVNDLWLKNPDNARHWLRTCTHWRGNTSIQFPLHSLPEPLNSALRELDEKRKEQRMSREAMREQLLGQFVQFKTVDQLAAAFPDFVKYIPKEESQPEPSYPVAVVSTLDALRNLGWPKPKEAA